MAKNGMNAICTYANYGWDHLKDCICRETARRGMKIVLEVHAFSLWLPRNLRAWRKMCDGRFMIYENTALHGMLSALRPNIRAMEQDFRRYRKMGVTGVILQAYIHSWKSYALNFHVLARLMWDPAPSAEEAIRCWHVLRAYVLDDSRSTGGHSDQAA